jgi:hypothetical protein
VGPKFRSLAAAFFLLGLFSGPARAADDTLAIALDKSLPGKNGLNTCEMFGRELYRRLVGAGGEAYYIVYNWKSMDSGWLCHAFVVCRDARGQYLGMDQNKRMPVLLPGKGPAEWIQWFNGPGEVELVSSFTDQRLAGQYADLSRPKGKKNRAGEKTVVAKQEAPKKTPGNFRNR